MLETVVVSTGDAPEGMDGALFCPSTLYTSAVNPVLGELAFADVASTAGKKDADTAISIAENRRSDLKFSPRNTYCPLREL